MKRRILTALLALCCLLSAAAPTALAEESGSIAPGRTLHITTIAELKKLAADCALDTYSDGMTVYLDADLDLSGERFGLIPVFNGVFEGGGHSITGLRPAVEGSSLGLFRYLRSEAVVRDLKVSGTLEPEIGRERVGGLAGSSAGRLENCSFEGTVRGLNYVGGLVGENTGSIIGCSVSASVDGKRFTGGIAGHSTGLILSCSSSAAVNTEINEADFDLENLSLIESVPLALLNAEDENVVSDSGGIVGYSGGIVMDCVNRGAVGYQHFGYNVGGVAGRQAGFLSGCENYGTVLGRKDVAGIVGQMEPFLELTESVNLADELVLLNAYMNAASSDLSLMSAQMRDALSGVSFEWNDDTEESTGQIYHAGEPIPESGGTGTIRPADGGTGSISEASEIMDEVSGVIEAVAGAVTEGLMEELNLDALNGLADNLYLAFDDFSEVYYTMSDSAGYLAQDLALANNQFSRVLLLMSNALGGTFDDRVFEDVSERISEEDVQGRVSDNRNFGRTEGDNNVGGIVGAMGVEYEFDLEDTLSEKVGANGIINSSYDAKCVCSGNVNRGEVLAKKDRVGGVVGSAEMGVVLRSEGYGGVSSSEGGYAGGIVGYSGTAVRSCYAMCTVSGSRYVGGIAGYGAAITDCASMIEADRTEAFLGAIAGWADMKAENAVERNVYVHESLGAVDGISYSGLAAPVSYEELLRLETLPEDFKSMKLSFLADGVPVAQLTLRYGGSVDPSQIPEVPSKAGCTGVWGPFEREDVRFSQTVEAVYTPYRSALASEETRGDSPLSIVLVEGEFADSAQVRLESYETEQSADGGPKVLESWKLRLEHLSQDAAPGDFRLRYQRPEPDERGAQVEIQVLRDGEWVPVETTENGSYLSFPAEGETTVFRAVEIPPSQWFRQLAPQWLYLGGAGLLLLLVLLIFLSARRKRKKKKAPEGAQVNRTSKNGQ